MDRIDYNDQTIYVPRSWSEVTLGVYERFYNDNPKTAREKVDYVAKVCDTDPNILLSWASEILAIIIDKIDFIYAVPSFENSPYIDIDGTRYIVNTEDKLTLAQWVDIEELQSNNAGDLSSVLAVVCLKAGEEYDPEKVPERAAMFRAQNMVKILPVVGFFLHYGDVLEQRTQALSKVHQIVSLYRALGSSFLKNGFGIILSTPLQTVKFGAIMIYLRFLLARLTRTLYTKKTNKLRKAKTVSYGKL